MKRRSHDNGFTLIELMLVVAIIGILMAIALDSYENYTSRTRAMSTATDLEPIELSVGLCAAKQGYVTGCSAGQNGVLAPTVSPDGFVGPVTVKDGVIQGSSTATNAAGANLTFKATASLGSNSTALQWALSGTICDGGVRGLQSGEAGCP